MSVTEINRIASLLTLQSVIFCSVCQIINTTITDIAPLAAYILSAAGSPTLLCVLGGQLLIHLKEAGERGVNSGTNYTPRNASDIEFGEVSLYASSPEYILAHCHMHTFSELPTGKARVTKTRSDTQSVSCSQTGEVRANVVAAVS